MDLNILYVPAFATASVILWLCLCRKSSGQRAVETKFRDLASSHQVGRTLLDLVDTDGAGSWPPNSDHSNWPNALRPYHDIYLEVLPLLSTAKPSLVDDKNIAKRSHYRATMQRLFAERIDLPQVEKILADFEAGARDVCTLEVYNGFYSCLAVSRHAYRWALIPIVKVAQMEKVVEFPAELDMPWSYLQRNYGMEADSGNNTANVLLNYNQDGSRAYHINLGISDLVTKTEDAFFRMFWDVEVMAHPIYKNIVEAIVAFEAGQRSDCVTSLQSMSVQLRDLLKVFYQNMTESRVSKSVWLSYCQGFQGWGCGKMVDGKFVEYDGLSGSHNLCFQVLDAFLGLERYMADENSERYIPRRQRELCAVVKKHSFFDKLNEDGEEDNEILGEMRKLVNHLKVFRSAHRARVIPYLAQPAPERVMMTAGKSFQGGASDDTHHLRILDTMLLSRLRDTIALNVKFLRLGVA